jgi:hypothetical protein
MKERLRGEGQSLSHQSIKEVEDMLVLAWIRRALTVL